MANSKTVEVPLEEPIGSGDGKIEKVTLQRPSAGQLRGLMLSQIMNMDATAMITLLPRITQPALLPEQIENELSPADFAELAGQVASFFFTEKAKGALGLD